MRATLFGEKFTGRIASQTQVYKFRKSKLQSNRISTATRTDGNFAYEYIVYFNNKFIGGINPMNFFFVLRISLFFIRFSWKLDFPLCSYLILMPQMWWWWNKWLLTQIMWNVSLGEIYFLKVWKVNQHVLVGVALICLYMRVHIFFCAMSQMGIIHCSYLLLLLWFKTCVCRIKGCHMKHL